MTLPEGPYRIALGHGAKDWVAVGSDGFLLWRVDGADEIVRAQVQRRANGWVVTGLHFEAPPGGEVQASHLRLFNLGQATAALAAGDHDTLAAGRIEGQQPLAPGRVDAAEALAWAESLPLYTRRLDLRINIPPRGQRDDGFYLHVALLLAIAGAQGGSAARKIAEANDVPVSTVYSWIKEIKRRNERDRQRERARLDLLDRGLELLGLTWDEYLDGYEQDGDDPLGVWDEVGDEVGPSEEALARLEAEQPQRPPT